ncbi:MAG: tyrosine--tRNA ligase [Bacteriovoracia bacterium]
MAIFQELTWRELVFQQTAGAQDYFDKHGGSSVYCGFDPTSDSLHVGSLVPLLALRRFQLQGYIPIALAGGATGLIGDPSGKASERTLQTEATVRAWTDKIKLQLEKFLDFSPGKYSAKVVNNLDWTKPLSTIEYLRDVGKHFTVNWMMGKDSVKTRIDREESGISYTEFSYMLLQAYDFYYLFEKHGCSVQIGGSDQWGNITAGIELVHKKLHKQAFGLTLPLVTTASGAKFGKTEAGAVWLDPEKTSPYAYYQFWLNVDDKDAIRYLKFFTFLDQIKITELEGHLKTKPEHRDAQKALASEMTKLTHGQAELKKVMQASEALFGAGEFSSLDEKTLLEAVGAAPSIEIASGDSVGKINQLLVETKLCASKSQANQMVQGGGVYMNNKRIEDPNFQPTSNDFLFGKFLLLRRGKKNYALVRIKGK